VRAALDRAGVAGGDAVVIGDTPHDVTAARGAGCAVVAVTTGRHTADDLAGADAVAPSLLEAARAAVRLLRPAPVGA
jgi:phosphoglycolate phosphatase